MRRPLLLGLILPAVLVPAAVAADDAPKRTPREALQPFNDLIGSWTGSGEPFGTREEKQKGFWQETIAWQWQFKRRRRLAGRDLRQGQVLHRRRAALPARRRPLSTHPSHLRQGGLGLHRAPSTTAWLTVEPHFRTTGAGDVQRLVISLLHANRYLYRATT